MKTITFNQFKRLLFESNHIYNRYEDSLCEIFDVDNIEEITEEDYKRIKEEYINGTLNESDSALLEYAEEMVIRYAIENGYNLVAHHGTITKFSEFKFGDIGFHFGTLDQAKRAVTNHISSSSDGFYFNVSISLHNPLVIDADLTSWQPESIFYHGKTYAYNYLERAHIKYGITYDEIMKSNDILNWIDKEIKNDIHSGEIGFNLEQFEDEDENSFYFLCRFLGFSFQEIFKFDNKTRTEQKEIIVKRIKSLGHDGIKYLNIYEASAEENQYSYIVFDANQMKNCEVISFKDGKIVPLDERFKSNSNNLFEDNAV